MADTPATRVPEFVRFVVYVLTAMLAAAYAVVEANTDVHWGWLAAYASWNAGAGILAAANTGQS
jgi:hypothetical protein